MKRLNLFLISILTVISLLYSCKEEEIVVESSEISTNTTWTSDQDYVIEGTISIIDGAVLTIEPGTKIEFGAEGRIDVGYSDNATFIAEGTEEEPIIFTSNHKTPTAGAWSGIFFWDYTQENSKMKHCIVEYAGSGSDFSISMYDCKISIDNCTISKSGNGGIKNDGYSEGGFVSFTNNKFEDINGYSISIYTNDVHTIGSGNIYNVEDNNGIFIHENNYLQTTNKTWLNQGIPYFITEALYIDGNLTIEPGTIFKFAADAALHFGYNENTTLIAEGTSENKIIFTSSHSSPAAGAWEGLHFWANAQASSSLKYCEIIYAGKPNEMGAVEINDCSIKMENCKISHSQGYGIYAPFFKGFTTAFQNNTIENCADHVMAVNFKHTNTLGTGNIYSAAENKGIKLCHGNYESSTNQTWLPQSVPYYIEDLFYINGNLTISDNCIFKMSADAILYIGFDSNTTVNANNVTFTSSASTPNPGDWECIYFCENAQNNNFTNCEFSYGGSYESIINISDCSVNLDGSTISYSENWGIVLVNGSYSGNVTFIDNGSGDVLNN